MISFNAALKIGITRTILNISGNWPLAIEALDRFEPKTLTHLPYFLNIKDGRDLGNQELQ